MVRTPWTERPDGGMLIIETEWFRALEDTFKEGDFESEILQVELSRLYAAPNGVSWTLFDSCILWRYRADCPEQERKENGFPSRIGRVNKFLAAVQEEKRRLIRYQVVQVRIDAEHTRLESLRKNVPDAPRVDHLIGYEAHLERSLDRALTQLERHQRMRLDQAVVPPIKVDISSS